MDFESFVNRLANRAMQEGLVGIDDIKSLCASVSKDAYTKGYNEGCNEGYTKAVADIEKQESH